MADQRVQLPPGMKPGTKQAQQFHQDLISSMQAKLLDYHVTNPGIIAGTGPHAGKFVRPLPVEQAQTNYAQALTGQPHSTLAHLGFQGDDPIPPETAQAVAQTTPIPPEHAFAPDEQYQQLHSAYQLAKLAPIASQTAYQAAGGPAVDAYLQTSKKPNLPAIEKFRSQAANPAPILKAAQALRQTEQSFGINPYQPTALKGAMNDYLGPPPVGATAPSMPASSPAGATPPGMPAPPPQNYGAR